MGMFLRDHARFLFSFFISVCDLNGSSKRDIYHDMDFFMSTHARFSLVIVPYQTKNRGIVYILAIPNLSQQDIDWPDT